MRLLKHNYMLLFLAFYIHVTVSLAGPSNEPPRSSTWSADTRLRTYMSGKRSKIHTFYNPSHSHCLTLHTFASLVPLQSASIELLKLYTELLKNASGPWLSLPTVSSFTAQSGNIYLDFIASGPYGVPWSFVAEFAEKMMEVTERGFVGRFSGEYRHLGSDAVIRVALRVVMAAAAA